MVNTVMVKHYWLQVKVIIVNYSLYFNLINKNVVYLSLFIKIMFKTIKYNRSTKKLIDFLDGLMYYHNRGKIYHVIKSSYDNIIVIEDYYKILDIRTENFTIELPIDVLIKEIINYYEKHDYDIYINEELYELY